MATQTGSTYISGTTTDSDEIPTNSSAIAERPRDARVTSIRKIVDFWATLFWGGLGET